MLGGRRRRSEIRLDHQRIATDYLGCSLTERPALTEDVDPLTEPHDEAQVVVDDEHGASLVVTRGSDGLQEVIRLRLVHPRCWLVEQEEARLTCQRAGNLDAALLPIRQGRCRTVGDVGQAETLEKRWHLLRRALLRNRPHFDVLQHRHLAEQANLLERPSHPASGEHMGFLPGGIDAIDDHDTLGRAHHPARDIQQRGLAAAVRTDQTDDLAFAHLERHAVERAKTPELLDHSGQRQHSGDPVTTWSIGRHRWCRERAGCQGRIVAMTPQELADAGVRLVALVLVDNAGIARMKCVPIDRLERAASHGIGWSTVWGLSLADDSFAHDPDLYSPSGDVRLRADLAAVASLGCSPGWAFAPVDHHEQTGEPWAGCQRGFLRRMTEQARERGIELKAAWELEWTVGREAHGAFEPLHEGPGYGAVTFERTGELMLALVDALQASGIAVEQIHPEYANGQMEISLPPTDPIAACDQAILARHVVRTVAGQHGWRASFAPRVTAGSVGNGAHVHWSPWVADENQFAGGNGQEGLRPVGEAFLAGVLEHLTALTALGAPTPLSYLRLEPSHWAGAFTCWGNDNREAALRLESTGGPSAARSANVEWKSVDGAANPYLVLGAVIAAGLDGVDRDLRPPAPVSVDPIDLTDSERAASGIERLPTSLSAAADLFAASSVLQSALGGFLHARIAAVSRAEAAAGEGLDEEALVTRYRWRF
jgi:glutamine synthetase